MQPYQWSLIGLVLDIVGVLLLSVEAIKLNNIRKLRTRFLLPFHDWVKPATVEFVDEGAGGSRKSAPDYGCVWWLFTHGGSGTVTVGFIGFFLHRIFPGAVTTIIVWFAALGTWWKVLCIVVSIMLLPTVLVYV